MRQTVLVINGRNLGYVDSMIFDAFMAMQREIDHLRAQLAERS